MSKSRFEKCSLHKLKKLNVFCDSRFAFRYPYNITKSTLNNVGAMSCWPQALGALMWIADFAKVNIFC